MSGPLDPATMTTIANYARGAWDDVAQNHPVWKSIREKGNIEYGVGGTSLEGPIEAGRYQAIISSPGQDVWDQYTPRNRHKRWTGQWAELFAGTKLDRGMLRRNTGPQALVKLRDTEGPAMARDLLLGSTNSLMHQFLQMNATVYAGTGLPVYGLPTMLPGNGYTGAATYAMATAITDYDLEGFNPETGALTGSAPANTDIEVGIGGAPTYQNYLNLSMKYNALTGVDNVEPDAWTPSLINTSYSGWTGTGNDEDDAIEKILQYAVFRSERFSGSDKTKRGNLGVLDRVFYQYLGAKKASRETIFVTPEKRGTGLPDGGYPSTGIFHGGILWIWDENMPTETAYCLNTNQMWFKMQEVYGHMDNPPFKLTGGEADGIIEVDTDWDPGSRAWLLAMTIPGQVVCNPRYFVRASNYSSS